MNKAVVVFLSSDSLVNELTVSGIWVKEMFVPVTPLSAPSTKVTISNVPPFVSNEAILKELQRFGKIASPVKTIPLGCKNAALKHVLSFRRQVHMFLNSPERTLEVSFRVIHGDDSFMVYASTDSMRCFVCGELGHKRFACPHKDKPRASASRDDTSVTPTSKEQGDDAGDVEIPGCSTAIEEDVNESEEVDKHEVQNNGDDVCADSGVEKTSDSQENMVDEMENLSQYTDDGLRDDEEQWSDGEKIADNDLYTLEQINYFLDKTKGKSGVEIRTYFPDIEKFVASVIVARKKSNNTELSQQKRFRLKKYLTLIRSSRKMIKARGKTK
ncbi:hypothetical protein IRJ41_006155 [Triplophysa rosa]|uniref:CCHC-type domain-containing protein n=1 Tax=Triplophysa rosa TaxID=992332 RepID=A0A9W7TW02_TRIRA|nr:hypothetical protein IRJ41_006155 [Triplophysa rosa]